MAFLGVGAVVGGVVKVAAGTKNAIDFLKSFNGIEEEGYILWKTMESIALPLGTAEQLMQREEALHVLQPSVVLLRFLIKKVETILEVGEDDEDDRPEGKESWTKWLKDKKDGKERKDRMMEVVPKITHAAAMLNLGLTTLSVQPALCLRIQPNSDLHLVPSAVARGKRLLEEFSFERIHSLDLAVGILWKSSGKNWRNKGCRKLCLERVSKELIIRSVPVKTDELEDADDDDEACEQQIWKVTTSEPALARYRNTDDYILERLGGNKEDLCHVIYHIDTENILEFQGAFNSGGSNYDANISVEVFETILALSKWSNGLKDEIPDVADIDEDSFSKYINGAIYKKSTS